MTTRLQASHLDKKFNDSFDDVGPDPVHPDESRDVSHVEVTLLIDELVENTADTNKATWATSSSSSSAASSVINYHHQS